jgi:biopolymer transport protein ExbD
MDQQQYPRDIASPAAPGIRAQLILAMLLAAIFPMLLLYVPIQTHAVKLDLFSPRAWSAPAAAPRAYLMSIAPLPRMPEDPAGYHRLVVTASERIMIDGTEVDMAGLRRRLDVIAVDSEWVDLRPDANARYELFLEVLTVTRRARLERLRLDNSPFRRASDER